MIDRPRNSEVEALRAEIERLRAEVAAERSRSEHELQFARRIQLNLMPPVPPQPAGWQIATRYRAARSIGGDFYDVYELPRQPGCFGLAIADVTGKGLTAALMMAFTRAVLRSAAYNGTGPGDALARTNRVLVRDARTGLLVTAFLGVLDADAGQVRYAIAGHEPPLLVRGGNVLELPAGGTILGLVDGAPEPDRSIELAPGDVLLAYTDGTTDAAAPDGRRFGAARLQAVVRDLTGTQAADLVEGVVAAVDDWAGGVEQADDITLLAVRRLAAGETPE
jgi:sigma-B regulation protein RsbU (phosphoserine phosphatase)